VLKAELRKTWRIYVLRNIFFDFSHLESPRPNELCKIRRTVLYLQKCSQGSDVQGFGSKIYSAIWLKSPAGILTMCVEKEYPLWVVLMGEYPLGVLIGDMFIGDR
jgi:hypothetical protein